jgi:hypothetical protein
MTTHSLYSLIIMSTQGWIIYLNSCEDRRPASCDKGQCNCTQDHPELSIWYPLSSPCPDNALCITRCSQRTIRSQISATTARLRLSCDLRSAAYLLGAATWVWWHYCIIDPQLAEICWESAQTVSWDYPVGIGWSATMSSGRRPRG